MDENQGQVQDPSEPNRVENDVQVESNEAAQEGTVDAPPAAEDGNQDVVDIHPESVENLNVIREDESDREKLDDPGEDTPQPEEPTQDQSAGQPPTADETPSEVSD